MTLARRGSRGSAAARQDAPDSAGTAETPATPAAGWWRSAAVYQVYPRSFSDSNGDGVGDLPGLISRLDYLAMLGIDALWLSPFYRSPMVDHGYDVQDHRDVDPLFGTLSDADALIAGAHERGLRLIIDLVPNHVSDQHPWFQQALSAAPGSAERARFVFRDGLGENGELPPNNWPSVFGGPAWSRVADGQWYLHLFAPEQPDLNWENTEVIVEIAGVMRFWLDRGVDGFRIDVAHGMAKDPQLVDLSAAELAAAQEPVAFDARFDRDGVHEILRGFRSVLNGYRDTMAIGEAWVRDDRLGRYLRPDELHQAFNFALTQARWGAPEFRSAIDASMAAVRGSGAACTWVLSNHDVVRHASRYGGGSLGRARARAAALLQLALPGAAYLYNGDELALENVELPDWALQDPTWTRSGHTVRGRDGERVPLPWEGDHPPFGFTSGPSTWLPMPDSWATMTVDAQLADPDSTLSLYRRALELRRELSDLRTESFGWQGAPAGCLAFRRGGSFVCAVNLSAASVDLPPGELLLGSGPKSEAADDRLPPNTAVWLRV